MTETNPPTVEKLTASKTPGHAGEVPLIGLGLRPKDTNNLARRVQNSRGSYLVVWHGERNSPGATVEGACVEKIFRGGAYDARGTLVGRYERIVNGRGPNTAEPHTIVLFLPHVAHEAGATRGALTLNQRRWISALVARVLRRLAA